MTPRIFIDEIENGFIITSSMDPEVKMIANSKDFNEVAFTMLDTDRALWNEDEELPKTK